MMYTKILLKIHRDTFIKIEVLFIDQFAPKYKLIKDIIYHILGRYDVHDGLRRVIEVLDQILMHVRVIGHQEARLHGVEIMLDLDLHHGECHGGRSPRRAPGRRAGGC